jgi:hypothetical protein
MITFTRPFHDATLDLDRSKGMIPSGLIDEYRFIRICGVIMEQIYCDVLTGEPSFKAIQP